MLVSQVVCSQHTDVREDRETRPAGQDRQCIKETVSDRTQIPGEHQVAQEDRRRYDSFNFNVLEATRKCYR